MNVDKGLVDQIATMWAMAGVPFHPSKEGIALYRKYLLEVASPKVMVFGATPEIVDLTIEMNVARVVSMERHAETAAAMRRLGMLDWTGVEMTVDNWLDRRENFAGAFDFVLCDGGLLFLSFPNQWTAFFEVARDYLRPGGRLITKAFTPPASNPSFDEFCRTRLDAFDSVRGSLGEGEERREYIRVATELWAATTFGTVRENAAFDQQLMVERLDQLVRELTARYPETNLRRITESTFLHLGRSQDGCTDVITGAPSVDAVKLANEAGFEVQVTHLPDPPVANCEYVLIAK